MRTESGALGNVSSSSRRAKMVRLYYQAQADFGFVIIKGNCLGVVYGCNETECKLVE